MTVGASGLGFEADVVALEGLHEGFGDPVLRVTLISVLHGPTVLSVRACWVARSLDKGASPARGESTSYPQPPPSRRARRTRY